MSRLSVKPGDAIDLGSQAGGVHTCHVFEEADIRAVEAALATKRPLLLRGEPGVGKTQLARAAAQHLGWGYCHKVVDARTEARDLKWSEDLVARLANAQLLGALGRSVDFAVGDMETVKSLVDIERYITPGPLWWAFEWKTAKEQAEKARGPGHGQGDTPPPGMVVLIDEIDKAESEVPNGLLEALGHREFTPTGRNKPVRADTWPLVVVTTNEERRLPDAFVRRCVVHHMRLPEGDELEVFLVKRGKAHFPKVKLDLLKQAAKMTREDREACAKQGLRPLPGQAEYIDLIRAVHEGASAKDDAKQRLEALAPYFLRKTLSGR